MKYVTGKRNKRNGISLRHFLKAIAVLSLVGCSGSSTRVANPSTTLPTTLPPTTAPVTTTTVRSMSTLPQQTTIATSTTVPVPTTTIPDNIVVEVATETPSEIQRLICAPQYDWDCEEALSVSWCESGHNPRAVSPPNRNGTIDRGLFQVNDVWRDAFPRSWGAILDPVVNTKMAYHIWKVGKRSWMYWTCQP